MGCLYFQLGEVAFPAFAGSLTRISKREDGFLLAQEGHRRAGMTSKYKNTRLLRYFVPRNDIRTFIYKGFRKNMGTGFTFCLALNVGGQKKTVPILKLPTSGMPFKRT